MYSADEHLKVLFAERERQVEALVRQQALMREVDAARAGSARVPLGRRMQFWTGGVLIGAGRRLQVSGRKQYVGRNGAAVGA